MIEPRAPDATDGHPTSSVRALGGGIAAGLAFAILWLAWTAAHSVDRGGALGLGEVLGIDGIAGGNEIGHLAAWATGPVAAAIAGSWFAPAAAWHRARNGANMGALTYVIAIGIAPLAALPAALTPTEFGAIDVGSALGAIPFLWLVSGVLLAPLYVACVIAGMAWAGLLGIARGPVAGEAPRRRPSIAWTLLLGALVGLGWLGGLALLANLSGDPGFVD